MPEMPRSSTVDLRDDRPKAGRPSEARAEKQETKPERQRAIAKVVARRTGRFPPLVHPKSCIIRFWRPEPSKALPQRELTLRGILLGGVITLLFTAANVYLGLKVGITFATSIPAAVISMAVLRFVRGSTILENNIVQTIASAAGTLAAIIFVLPG